MEFAMSKTEAKTLRHVAALKAHRTRAEQSLKRARNPERRRALAAQVRAYGRRLAGLQAA